MATYALTQLSERDNAALFSMAVELGYGGKQKWTLTLVNSPAFFTLVAQSRLLYKGLNSATTSIANVSIFLRLGCLWT
jgi:hypothetical protein